MTNIVGFAWKSALFALRNHAMQPRKEMTLMQPKLPQDERYEQRPDGTIRRFRQQTPPAQSTPIFPSRRPMSRRAAASGKSTAIAASGCTFSR